MNFEMSDRDVEVIRMALRTVEDGYKRNDFQALVLEVQELRSRLNDAHIDRNLSVH
jgi:hypothetical protein